MTHEKTDAENIFIDTLQESQGKFTEMSKKDKEKFL
jgi:hypothetical protein